MVSMVQVRLNAVENYIKELEAEKNALYDNFNDEDTYAAFRRGQICGLLVEAKAHRRTLKDLYSHARFIDELHEKEDFLNYHKQKLDPRIV